MGDERKRAHRRALALGLGASVAVHAAVLGWATFSVPMAGAPADGVESNEPGPAPDFEVVRLVEVPAADEAPVDVAVASGSAAASNEGSAAASPELTAEEPTTEVAEAVAAAEPPPAPEEPDRARPVAERSRPDIQAQLAPPTLAVDVPYPTTPARPARAAAVPVEEAAPPAEAPVREGAGSDSGIEEAEEEEGDGGGWGIGDLFRGISISISGGGNCVPGLINGRPSPAVTSVNDRNPVGGLGGIGPSGPVEPMGGVGGATSIGRLRGGGGIGGVGGIGKTGGMGKLGGIGGIGR